MSSFVDVLNKLKATLENHPELQAFCQAKWGKALTVRVVFKKRAEVLLAELPIIMLTRPQVAYQELNAVRDSTHRMRLYSGFQQSARDLGVYELVEFEEQINNAVLQDPTIGGLAIDIAVIESANDEGACAPQYFTAIDYDVRYRRFY